MSERRAAGGAILNPGPRVPYLELVSFPADAAREAGLLDQLFHLLQEGRLGHDLALLISLHTEPPVVSQVGASLWPLGRSDPRMN